VADLALLPWGEAEPELKKALHSGDVWIRYWALMVCTQFGEEARPVADLARGLSRDDHEMVRVRAAEFFGCIGEGDPRAWLQEVLSTTDSPVVSLLALQSVVYLRDGPRHWDFTGFTDSVKSSDAQVERRLDYLKQ
jgi:HEAT repeat protein